MSIISVLLLATAAAAEPATLPGWMAGCWTEKKAEAWTEECWTAPAGGSMLGSGRSVAGGKLTSWEAMQILTETDGALAFYAAPGGVGRTRFALASRTATEIVFVNAGHDYPQRVRYWREGDALNAEISRVDGSRAMRWSFRRP